MPDFDPLDDESQPKKRGKGRGGNFFAVDRGTWERLWNVDSVNRLNLVITYLVLSAGTGSDHQLTKWSTKACETHTGMGKPRAKVAVDELIRHELVHHTERSTRAYPQYQLQAIPLDSDPIFMPVAMVIGLKAKASILRRVRETGDVLLLRMLVDLYGLVQIDATFGIPISVLSKTASEDYPSRKVFEIGVHAIWALRLNGTKSAAGEWMRFHNVKGQNNEEGWEDFWARVTMLESIGALWYEPWIFDGDAVDAEPLFPVDIAEHVHRGDNDDVYQLTQTMVDAAEALCEERTYIFDNYESDALVTLTQHRQAPAIRGVARLRIEADTPGRRLSYFKRRTQIEIYEAGYAQIAGDARVGEFGRPMNTVVPQ